MICGRYKCQHIMQKIQSIFSKLCRFLLFAHSHNIRSQNTGLVDAGKDVFKKDQREYSTQKQTEVIGMTIECVTW